MRTPPRPGSEPTQSSATQPGATQPTAPRWLDDDQQRAWRSFVRMHTLLTARLNRDLIERSGISEADYAVLANLSEAPEGRLRAFELGRAVRWEKSRLSHHLTRMERRGLVRREDCTTDARGAFVVMTDAGSDTIRAAAPLHVEVVRECFIDVVSAEQLSALAELSDQVLERLESSGC